jgi:tetratricopeptide (TPR) repeat protein
MMQSNMTEFMESKFKFMKHLKAFKRLYGISMAIIAAGFLGMQVAPLPFAHALVAAHDSDNSLSGNFLAGRFASRVRDNENAVEYFTRALRDDPENRLILERTMLLLIAAGDFHKALRFAGRIVEYKPKHRAARLVLALNHFRAGRYSSARKQLKYSSNVPLAKLTSSVLTAWSYVGEGKPQKALNELKALKSINSLRSFYGFHRALIADVGGLKKTALAAYKKAQKVNGGSLRLVQAYGRFLERKGKGRQAIKIYEKFLKAHPNHAVIQAAAKRVRAGNKPNRLIADAKTGAAELMFGIASVLSDEAGVDIPLRFTQQALYLNPKFVLAQVLQGDIYTETKRYEKAIAAYRLVPASSPLKRNADIQSANNLNRLKKTVEARTKLEGVIKRFSNDYEPIVVLADLLRSHSKFKEAAGYYTRAVDLIKNYEKRHWLLFYHRGIALERSKQWSRAEKDFKQALKLNPKQPSVLNYLGYSWVEKRMNLDQAMSMIRTAVDLRSGDGYIVDSLGWAYFQLGKYTKAVKVLERSVGLRPDDPVINDHLGDAYWHVGRKLEAKFQWNHARDLKPEPAVLKKILEKLKHGLDKSGTNTQDIKID